MATKDWCLRIMLPQGDTKELRFRSLYECVAYAEDHNLNGCEVVGPILTTAENQKQLDTVKQYFTEDCGSQVH